MHPLILFTLLLVVLVPVLLLLIRRHRQQFDREELSPITKQHIDLFQGGQLSEVAVESAKLRFREMLERGEVDAVENSLRAGMQYVVLVRALAELGTEDAGRILERQLERRLTDDQIEQAWYWIDLAGGLRALNRAQSLPHLLRTADRAGDIPLSHFFAAETVCFLGFTGYLRQPGTPLGRAALRVLLRALEGLRFGLSANVVTEGRLGEMVETLYDHRSDEEIDPMVVRIFFEALRLLNRASHLAPTLQSEMGEQETFDWQISRLAALEPTLEDYLQEAVIPLCLQLTISTVEEQREILQALIDIRAEAGLAALSLAMQPGYPHAKLALELISWSREPRVGQALREWVLQKVPLMRRAQARARMYPPRRPSMPVDFPYATVLRTLRGHPGPHATQAMSRRARPWARTKSSA